MIFQDQYLEEITQEQLTTDNPKSMEDPIVKILEKLIEGKQSKEKQIIKMLAEKFFIEKFDGRNKSACHWMDVFEKESARFELLQDEEQIEIFRLVLIHDDQIYFTIRVVRMENNLFTNVGNTGWATSKYASSFKCQVGSLLEYAIKPEKLLLEIQKTIDQGTLIDIIAAGLPNSITDRINKEEIVHTKDLFHELGKLEHLATKKKP